MREKLLKEIVEGVEVFDWKYSGDSLETSKEYKMLKYLSEESLKQIKQELESYVLGWDDFNEVLESMIKHVKYIYQLLVQTRMIKRFLDYRIRDILF